MLKSILEFLTKLFIFGIGYFAINIAVDVVSSFITVPHTLRPVVLFIWTVLPGLYLIKCAFELYKEAQEARAE